MTDNNDGLRVRHQHNLNENRQNRNRAYYANSISRKQVSPLAFNLTPGALFYPSCGRDSFEPIQMFIDSVTEFHFVDYRFWATYEGLKRAVEFLDKLANVCF